MHEITIGRVMTATAIMVATNFLIAKGKYETAFERSFFQALLGSFLIITAVI